MTGEMMEAWGASKRLYDLADRALVSMLVGELVGEPIDPEDIAGMAAVKETAYRQACLAYSGAILEIRAQQEARAGELERSLPKWKRARRRLARQVVRIAGRWL